MIRIIRTKTLRRLQSIEAEYEPEVDVKEALARIMEYQDAIGSGRWATERRSVGSEVWKNAARKRDAVAPTNGKAA